MSSTTVMPVPRIQFFDSSGRPLAGGMLYSYQAGTSTPLATYTDSSGTIQNPNPVVLDGGGFAAVWISGQAYKFVLFSSGGSQQWAVDNVSSFQGLLTAANTWSGNQTFSGNNTHSGTETFKTLNGGAIVFADQFSGTDASAKIQAAINALPANGGTVDARALLDTSGTGSTTIDPGTKAVTLLLGPTTYFFSQVILKRSFHIIGAAGFPATGTIIQATGGNTTPPFIMDQSGTAAQGVILRGFALQGTAGNTSQNAISLIAPNGSGMWYSEFDDLLINGFAGIGLDLDAQAGGASGGIHQFNTFKRVVIFRTSNGGYALQIIGRANSLKFENCEFDGIFNTNNTGGNIFIGQGTATVFPPYNIKFDLVTCQYSNQGFVINGADGVSIDQGHFEAVQQVFTVGTGSSFGSLGITIHDSVFGNNSGVGVASPGVGLGSGYIIKNTGSTANVSVQLVDTHTYATPDTFLAGNLGSIASFGNSIGPEGSYAYQPIQVGTGNDGFGNGSSGTAVTTTTLGTGTGPAAPQTVVKYEKLLINGILFWIPLFQ